jgi:hypothetical protein
VLVNVVKTDVNDKFLTHKDTNIRIYETYDGKCRKAEILVFVMSFAMSVVKGQSL